MSEPQAEYQTDQAPIAWQDFEVTGGRLSVNQAGQIEGNVQTNGPGALTLFFVIDGKTATAGWSPETWPFAPNREELPTGESPDDVCD